MCGCRYGLLKRDAYKEGTVSGTSSYFSPATTTNSYDANNNLYAVTDSGNAANNRSFVTDDAGRVLYKAQNGAVERQLIANGEVLGRFGGALADFNFGYTPISASFPKANPGTFAVGASDSLRSIAKAVYGDSSLWYLIAEANGLQSDKELRVGQTLNVPNRVTSAANNAGTFKPYDPSVVGDTAPTLPNPPPPPGKKGCGGLGKLIMVVVAVVATIYTAGAMSGATGGFFSTMQAGVGVMTGGVGATGMGAAGAFGAAGSSLGLAGTAAVAGAVGSIASQVAGNMLGVQDGFSWKGVALGAISAGATAGVGQVLGQAGGSLAGSNWQMVAARAAVGNAITQGVGVITGLQAKFDWKGVAASAVGAGVGQELNVAMGYNPAANFDFSKSFASSLGAGTAAAVMRGGRVAIQQVAIDAFGNALGSSLADMAMPKDPLGDFIAEQLQAQSRRDMYGLGGMAGASGSGLKVGAGQGLRHGDIRASGSMAPTPEHVDIDAGYQMPGQYVTRDNASVTASVKAGAYGGSMERVARSMLGPNASQREINNYVGQLLEINGINDPRRVQAGQDILLPDANTPAATKGLTIYGKDIALGEHMKVEAALAHNERVAAADRREMQRELNRFSAMGGTVPVAVPSTDFEQRLLQPGEAIRGNLFFGGAGMDGGYINDMVRAFGEKGMTLTSVDREKWSAGTALDAFIGVDIYRSGKYPVQVLLDNFHQTGPQFNLVGYSYGSLAASQVAINYAEAGTRVDNLVLIGSPIGEKFLNQLQSTPNIKNVVVVNLAEHGDPIRAGMTRNELLLAAPTLTKQMVESSGHFYYAPSNAEGQARRDALAAYLYSKGVR